MEKSLLNLLQKSVNDYSEFDAVIYEKERITYSELWSNICNINTFLCDRGLEQGGRVGLLMENSHDYIAAYYGIQAAGGAVVAMNAAAKSRDILNWLQHSEASWLIVDARHNELPEVLKVCSNLLNILLIGKTEKSFTDYHHYNWNEIKNDHKNKTASINISDTQQLASIIYTSGTTGNQKGVMLSHENLYHNVRSILEYLRISSKDKVLNVLPFYYSYGNSVLHTHLAVGGSLILENSLMYPKVIIEKMVKEGATGFSGVPSTFSILINKVKLNNYDLSSVRYMTQAGGPMTPENIKIIINSLPNIKFYVMYGQTEATARLTYLPSEKLETKLGSVGLPIPGVEIEVRDKENNTTKQYVTGEIWAKGKNIMMGYWKNENETKKVIQDGWLKTGDLAHKDEDGYIYIDGRKSEMIKSGAHRISPMEIEEVIMELEGVEEVAVVGIPDELLGQIIKAVIVRGKEHGLDRKRVQAHCRKNIAIYKVPKQIEFVKELPKTASGKVKRYLLSGLINAGENNVQTVNN